MTNPERIAVMTLRDGAAMARARQIFGLTVDGMAERLDIPAAVLRHIEAGRDLPVKTKQDRGKVGSRPRRPVPPP
jgi:hypothetical protein